MDTMTQHQTKLAPMLGIFGLMVMGLGILVSTAWITQAGIMFAVMGFVLLFILRF